MLRWWSFILVVFLLGWLSASAAGPLLAASAAPIVIRTFLIPAPQKVIAGADHFTNAKFDDVNNLLRQAVLDFIGLKAPPRELPDWIEAKRRWGTTAVFDAALLDIREALRLNLDHERCYDA